MIKKLTNSRVSALRALFRAAVICGTAFGLDWTQAQVAATQLAAEAVLLVAVQFTQDEPQPVG